MKLSLILIIGFCLLSVVDALDFFSDLLGFFCSIFPFNVLLFFLCPPGGDEGDANLEIEINGPGAAFPGQNVEFSIVVSNTGE